MKLTIIIFSFLSVIAAAQAQGILIGPSTLNGSFESGVSSPWGGVTVTQNASFASHGTWLAIAQGSSGDGSHVRTDSFQTFSADPANGFAFLLAFDARNGTSGFDSVSASISGKNGDGTSIFSTVISQVNPSLNTQWATHQTTFQLPEAWDGSGYLRIDIQFDLHGGIGGTTYSGYLDNVVLQQIPEPSSLALFGFDAFAIALLLLKAPFSKMK